MPYDPQRSRPRQSISDDDPAPVDAILDEVAEEAAEDEAVSEVVIELAEALVIDELIIEELAAEEALAEEMLVDLAETATVLPDGIDIEVLDGEVIVHTSGADIEVAASGNEVIVHTADADVDINAADDIVKVSTADDDVIVDVSPPRLDLVDPLGDGQDAGSRGGRSRIAKLLAVVGVLVLAAWVVRCVRRRGQT